MARHLLSPIAGQLSQPEVRRAVRSALNVLRNPLNIVDDPEGWMRAQRVLSLVFDCTPEDHVFAKHVTHGLSKVKVRIMRELYDEWRRERARARRRARSKGR